MEEGGAQGGAELQRLDPGEAEWASGSESRADWERRVQGEWSFEFREEADLRASSSEGCVV